MRGRAAGLALLSLAAHVAVPALLMTAMPDHEPSLRAEHGVEAWVHRGLGVPVAPWATQQAPAGVRAMLSAQRARLVSRARSDRRAGKLALGDFLLEANRLDALERGRILDVATVRLRFEARVRAIRDASPERALSEVVEEVFEDISYIGRPGGLMSDVLLEGGGACEPLSHLVVAAVADAGHPERVALRFYGGVGRAGVRHLAPIDLGNGAPLDLMTGQTPASGGIQFPAGDIVEVYARAHGIPSRDLGLAGHAAGEPPTQASVSPLRVKAKYSMDRGYPANVDAHPSGMPLYARRAIGGAPRRGLGGGASAATGAKLADATGPDLSCTHRIRISTLDPLRWTARWPSSRGGIDSIAIEPRQVPLASEIARYAELIRGAEEVATDPSSTGAERLMSWACLAARYGRAAVDFSLLGEHELARIASENERNVRVRGAEHLETLWQGAAPSNRARLSRELSQHFSSRMWLLLLLDGGEDLVRTSREGSMQTKKRGWGSFITLAALVVNPATRARTLRELAALPRQEQIEVMHEVFRAHGDMGHGSSAFVLQQRELDEHSPPSEFARAYRVFRRLAWRLWGGGRGFAELSTALHQELAFEDLGAEWEAPMLTYYLNYVIGLLHYREDGLSVLTQLAALIEERPELNIGPLRKRVQFLLANKRVDPKAVAESFRKQPDQ